MNEKPQETRGGGQEDLLEQIITQGLEKMNAPVQTAAAEETPESKTDPAPKQEDSGGTAPPVEKKNKRSAVYLYLLILFGAAFMMLLLAYFIQQRSSENTISDLRDSMNLSREQLLAQIRELEEEVTALKSENEDWASRYSQLEEQAEQYQQENYNLSTLYFIVKEQSIGWENIWALEQNYQAGDYESCAVILLMQAKGGSLVYHPPTPVDRAQERYREISQAVIDAGILDEDYHRHPDSYDDLLDAYLSSASASITGLGPNITWKE